jgi:NAD(P)-dependent dehydrogenase (short-subunit alcohol dehydrogenase family)
MHAFANRVALITGAGGGIGRQLARQLAAEGAAVAAVDVKSEPLTALAAELNGKRVAWAVGDVTDRSSLQTAVDQVEERLGPTDLLIACAGIGIETTATNFRAEDIEAQLRVNLIGVANSIGAVLPGMLSRKQGHLVGLSSLASYRGLPKMAGYCASKAGVNALLDSLRLELKPHGISVTTICPGWIRTPLTETIDVPKAYLMEVDYAVRQIVDAIRQRRSFFAFPRPGVWRMRLLRWLPADWSDRVVTYLLRRLSRK